jgi:hypothetical protein
LSLVSQFFPVVTTSRFRLCSGGSQPMLPPSVSLSFPTPQPALH